MIKLSNQFVFISLIFIFLCNYSVAYYTDVGRGVYALALVWTFYCFAQIYYQGFCLRINRLVSIFITLLFIGSLQMNLKGMMIYFLFTVAPLFAISLAFSSRLFNVKLFSEMFNALLFIGILSFFLQPYLTNIVIPNPTDERVYNCFALSCVEVSNAYRYALLFDEPGTLGCICGMLLFFCKRLGISSILVFFSGLLSFSLFFYIFIAIGFAIIHFKARMVVLLSFLVFIIPYYLFDIVHLFDSEILSHFVLNRFLFDDGTLVGVRINRTSDTFSSFFDDLSWEYLIFGIRNSVATLYDGFVGLTYRTYIIEYGWLQLVILLGVLISLTFTSELNFREKVLLVVFYFLFFYQRPLLFKTEYLFFILLIMHLSYVGNNSCVEQESPPME